MSTAMNTAPIRWDEVHARLRKSEESLREALSGSAEASRAVLRRRALQLAREQTRSKPAAPGIPALVFRAGRERYAIPLDQLTEVAAYRGCTSVPGAGPELLGVINLRGEMRPVIDVARLLAGIPSAESGALLILRNQAALKVDAAEELREIRADEMAAPTAGRYVRPLASGTLSVLDADAMLSTVFSTKESHPL